MGELAPAGEKRMQLRYAGTCRVCGIALPARAEAVYERTTKTVRCVSHGPEETAQSTPEPAPESTLFTASNPPRGPTGELAVLDAGTPGGSARREFERRQRARQDRVRANHPKLGRLILALRDDPQSTRAWDAGAAGEERLGCRLSDLAAEDLRVLHDRRIPGSRANIDHLAVTPTGVWVIDAKKYQGRPQPRSRAAFFANERRGSSSGLATPPNWWTGCSSRSQSWASLLAWTSPCTGSCVSSMRTGRSLAARSGLAVSR